ncbi:putative leucine-rich repeat-containing protein DDB_G0290503 isoform X4 [Drosophila bipectinata]|uniref:putative leucine-rich repeat-containing protein DDB_G0290503 isoform X4 n=1 Tax=Drosophila bipectinata TaxID=42026 RepID=UPI0038B369DE
MDSTSEVLESCIESPNSNRDTEAINTDGITGDKCNSSPQINITNEKSLECTVTVDTDDIQLQDELEIKDNTKENSSTGFEGDTKKVYTSMESGNDNDLPTVHTTSKTEKEFCEKKELVDVTKVEEREVGSETESEDGTECSRNDSIEEFSDEGKLLSENEKIAVKSETIEIDSSQDKETIEESRDEGKLVSENGKVSVKSENIEINSSKDKETIEESRDEGKLVSENGKVSVKSENIEINSSKDKETIEESRDEGKLVSENGKVSVKSENIEINSSKDKETIEESRDEGKLVSENGKVSVKSENIEINSSKDKEHNERINDEQNLLSNDGEIKEKNRIVSEAEKDDYNRQIKHIISDIDVNIRAQMQLAKLKAEEQKLIDKQNELTHQIQQQQQLAQELSLQNQIKLKQLEQMPAVESKIQPNLLECNPKTSFKDHNNPLKTVDLRKIFTPATDTKEILPKNQKEFLDDVKVPCKENSVSSTGLTHLEKIPLKLIMNPNGQVRDYDSLKELINIEAGLLSPDNCAELITALQLHQGRGAELFAKRRKKANNWIVDETNAETQCLPSGIPDYQQNQIRPATSPNILPAYSDAGKHRVQLNIHQNQLIEKYSKPGLQFVSSPWEAALQTGSASSAFLEPCKNETIATPHYSENGAKDLIDISQRTQHDTFVTNQGISENVSSLSSRNVNVPPNTQRNLAYTPSVAQGWGGPNVKLPNGLFVPKEISLSSYAPPPAIYHNQQKFQAPRIVCSNSNEDQNLYNIKNGLPLNEIGSKSSNKYQKIFTPTRYQEVPKEVQIGSQVNFSPAQLSTDKISRFENGDNSSQNSCIHQYLTVRPKTNVRNASPTPFGVTINKSATRSPSSIPSFGTTLSYPSSTTSAKCGQFYNSKALSQLQKGPTSNIQAHGWEAKKTQEDYWCSPQHHGNLPYTDF